MKNTTFFASDVQAIATLAHIPVSDEEKKKLAEGFNTTMNVVDTLFSVDIAGVTPTSQVTGLENILREDEIDGGRIFTQEQALANAPRKRNGYFVVDQVLEQ